MELVVEDERAEPPAFAELGAEDGSGSGHGFNRRSRFTSVIVSGDAAATTARVAGG